MSSNNDIARPDQIAELTRGVELPLEAIKYVHLRLIAKMIVRALSDLRQSQSTALLSAKEVDMNTLMETRLNRLREEDLRWKQLISSVKRGVETVNYNGAYLEKRPDLSIHLTRRSPSFPLIVECKLLNLAARKNEALYCKDGLARFIRGDYAWATREAFMLGYVYDGASTLLTLNPFLADAKSMHTDVYMTVADLVSLNMPGVDLSRSEHGRNFSYLGTANQNPGPIAVWHLWVPIMLE